jgi:hypothetical protein
MLTTRDDRLQYGVRRLQGWAGRRPVHRRRHLPRHSLDLYPRPEDLESTAQLARKRTRVVALWTVAAIAAAVVASVIQSRQP